MKTGTKLTKFTPYVITGFDSTSIGRLGGAVKHYGYRYVNFNRAGKSMNPMIVTAVSHYAPNQVYFANRIQAEAFMQKFTATGRAKRSEYNLKAKPYHGIQKNAYFRPVKTIYGNCLEVVNI